MKFRNFPQVSRVCFGRGSLDQVSELLEPHRKGDAPFIFFIDNFFNGKTEFTSRFPLKGATRSSSWMSIPRAFHLAGGRTARLPQEQIR